MGRKRDKNGRFIKGDIGGPGRRSKPTEKVYWNIAKTKCSLDDWAAIIDRAITDAKSGDKSARAFLSDILIGSPDKLRERQDVGGTEMPPIDDTAGVVALLAREIGEIGRFENDPRRAATLARLADGILKAIELDTLAARLDALELALGERKE